GIQSAAEAEPGDTLVVVGAHTPGGEIRQAVAEDKRLAVVASAFGAEAEESNKSAPAAGADWPRVAPGRRGRLQETAGYRTVAGLGIAPAGRAADKRAANRRVRPVEDKLQSGRARLPAAERTARGPPAATRADLPERGSARLPVSSRRTGRTGRRSCRSHP